LKGKNIEGREKN